MKLTKGEKSAFSDDIRKAFERKEHLQDREHSDFTERVIRDLQMQIETYARALSLLGYGYNIIHNKDGYTETVEIVKLS